MNQLVIDTLTPPIVEFKSRIKKAVGPNITFDMSQAVPVFPTFKKINEHLIEDIKNLTDVGFYTDVPGTKELKDELKTRHPLGAFFPEASVCITVGANHAMYSAMLAMFNAGDRITLLEPVYFNFEMAARMLGLNFDMFPMDPANGFQLKADTLISFLRESKSKGVVLISPNNPTGACYSRDEMLTLLKWCRSNKVEILLDETYYLFLEEDMHSGLGEFLSSCLSLVGSFSKCFSLTGYRVGYLVTRPEVYTQLMKIQDTLVICAPHISQRAAYWGLKLCSEDVNEQRQILAKQRTMMKAAFIEFKNFKLKSIGVFFAYVEHPWEKLTATDATLKLYEHTGIVGLPGSIFGPSQEKFIRLAYANLSLARALPEALNALLNLDKTI